MEMLLAPTPRALEMRVRDLERMLGKKTMEAEILREAWKRCVLEAQLHYQRGSLGSHFSVAPIAAQSTEQADKGSMFRAD